MQRSFEKKEKGGIRFPIVSLSLATVGILAAVSLYQYLFPRREILPTPPQRADSCIFTEDFNPRPRNYQRNVLELKLTPTDLSSGVNVFVSGCEFKTRNRDELLSLLDGQLPGANKIYYLDDNHQMISDSAVQSFKWNNAGFSLTSSMFVVPSLTSATSIYAPFDFREDSMPSFVRAEMDKDFNAETQEDKEIIDIPIIRNITNTQTSTTIIPSQQHRLPSGQVTMCVYDEKFDAHPPTDHINLIKIVLAPEENPNTLEDLIVSDCSISTYLGVSTYSNPFNFYSYNPFNFRRGDNFVRLTNSYGNFLRTNPTTRFEWESNLVSLDRNRYLVPERDSSLTIYLPHRNCARNIIIERNLPSESGIGSFTLAPVPIEERADVGCGG